MEPKRWGKKKETDQPTISGKFKEQAQWELPE